MGLFATFSLLIHDEARRKTLFISYSFFTLRVIVTDFMNNADTCASVCYRLENIAKGKHKQPKQN